MVAPVGASSAKQTYAEIKTEYAQQPKDKVEKKFSDSEKKSKELEDIKLFDLKADTLVKTVTATAKKTPIAELAKAQAIVFTPIFDFGKGIEHIASFISIFNPNKTATAGGLKKPENNTGSNDKKEKQNAFISWHKGLEELREEKLLGTDNSFNVMA